MTVAFCKTIYSIFVPVASPVFECRFHAKLTVNFVLGPIAVLLSITIYCYVIVYYYLLPCL